MNLNKYTIFFLIVFLFSGCSTIKDNLSLKKNIRRRSIFG